MLKKILFFAEKYDMLPDAGVLLVCVSGGADSMCLLHAMKQIASKRGFTVEAAHVNHMLRGRESDRDEAFVREYCRTRGINLHTSRYDTKFYAKENTLGIEDGARRLRYGFFDEIMEKTGAVGCATAHTADDNAETVIMNLTRGAGAGGMRGIPAVRGRIIRPMLSVTRDEVIEFLKESKTPYVEDSTNASDEFTRNRIRHNVIPILKEINPRFTKAVYSMTEHLAKDEQFFSRLVDEFMAQHCVGNSADADAVLALPEAVSNRVIMRFCGGGISGAHVDAVRKLCAADNPSARISIPAMTVAREYDKVVFGDKKTYKGFAPVYPAVNKSIIIPCFSTKMTCNLISYDGKIDESRTRFFLKYIDLSGSLVVRPRQEGDRIRLCGRSGTKSLKKLFIERRIPAAERNVIPVIADDRGVLAVYGIGYSEIAVKDLKKGDITLEIIFEDV